MKRLPVFDYLNEIYSRKGFSLYLVGGSVRDYLLNKEVHDFDFVTDALPKESLIFLPDANGVFAKYGVLKTKILDRHCDIATLREEREYADHRHPDDILFIKDPRKDSCRRDFTINALYLDKDYRVLDYHHGMDDLQEGIIRFIGDPYLRIKEDPLRIARAERFASSLGFVLDQDSARAIMELRPLLKEISPAKLDEERKKGWKGQI